jgi:hypothetical protein
MERHVKLELEFLSARDLPSATFYWAGSDDSNANNPNNWRNGVGQKVNEVPDWDDRIIIDVNSQRTMYIHAEDKIECGSINVLTPGPGTLTLDPGDPSNGKGLVYVRGDLNILGSLLPPAAQSSWTTGVLEIDSSNALDPGKVTLIGGVFTYLGGQIDTVENNTGLFYVIGDGTLKLTANPGTFGAKIFVGRDYMGGEPLVGNLLLNTPGTMTFVRDATIGIAPSGKADLNSGSIKLGTGATGWFENYGKTYVNGNIPSDMYFNNVSGILEIAAGKSLLGKSLLMR